MSDYPQAGDPMPEVAMETPDGGTVKPSDFRGRKLAVFFYPKDNTPGCTTEAKDFTALAGEFEKAGVALLGVSKDAPQKHRNFIAKHDLKVPLATDASINLGVVVTEWVTNAFKYAYPDGTGEVRVRIVELPDERLELVVEDDGVGRVEGAPAKGTGLGTRIVTAMAASMQAKIDYRARGRGMSAHLTFPRKS